MARSVHVTVKRVFFRKTKAEIAAMARSDDPDPDVIALWAKRRVKRIPRPARRRRVLFP